MSWTSHSASDSPAQIRRKIVYVHHLSIRGQCTKCGNAFNVAFTKEQPDGAFGPKPEFECPCGHFNYDPEDDSYLTKETSLTRDELRTAYDLASREIRT